MSLSDLTGTRWVLNNQLSTYAGGTYSVKLYTVDIATDEPTDGLNSETNKDSFSSISVGYNSGTEFNQVRFDNTVIAYGNDTKTLPDQWLGVITVPFTITGGTDATNSELIAWLESNASTAAPDVTISYNGSIIASLSDSGTEVLETDGKICEDDITVSYTRYSPNLQSKQVWPAIYSQTVSPDSGYDGLSNVSVAAISPTKAAQTYTPTTTDQTIASGRWLIGNQTIKGDANLVASNIKKDVQIFGVTGSYEGSGGGGVAEKDVNFIDYDGTILYSYTASEFANLSALPDNPSHEGLVAQGWNWTLANAKTYVASYGKLWIGQMYITESGDTEIDIELHAPRLSPYLGIAVNGTVEVDWGDGAAKSTITGSSLTSQIMTPHVYATDGSYTIKIHVVSGSFSLYGSSTYAIFSGNLSSSNKNKVYTNNVKRVRIGSSFGKIDMYAFYNCYSLASITIPSEVTSSIGTYAFSGCSSLASVTIPSGVTNIGGNAFYNCHSLASIAIPSSVTFMSSYTFSGCPSLASITIPSGVTNIGSNTFGSCYSLASIPIPSSVTSMSPYAFYNCYSLASITIPSGVTSIGTYEFYSCYGLGLIRFEPTTPPTVDNSNAWTNIPSDFVIFVPVDSYHSYITGTNYPSSSTYTYIGFKTYANNATLPSSIAFYPNGGTVSYTVTWYATKEDAINQTNAITIGNGKEIYARLVASAAVAP